MIKEKEKQVEGTVEEVRGTVEANKQFLEKEIQISSSTVLDCFGPLGLPLLSRFAVYTVLQLFHQHGFRQTPTGTRN